jgi:hypothetical protein
MAITNGVTTLRDGYNGTFSVKTRVYPDGTQAFYHVLDKTLPTGTNRSGTITAGSVSQQIAAAQVNRTSLTFQNISDTVMYVSDSGMAASPTSGYMIIPGMLVETETNNQINVYCITAGKSFIATESIIT